MSFLALSSPVEAAAFLDTDEETEASAIGPPDPRGESDSAPPLDDFTDSPGGPSPPPGSVTSVYVPAAPIVSSLPSVASPRLSETPASFRYATVVGTYEFSKVTPYLTSYATSGGDLLVTASTFVVVSSGIVPFVNPTVLDATDYRFQSRYDLLHGTANVGNVSLKYDFRDDGPPKITATLNHRGNETFSLSWVSITVDSVAFNGTALVDFGSEDPPVPIGTTEFRLLIGPDDNPANWSRRLTIDWSDVQSGSAFAGQVSVAGLSGPALLVAFPAAATVIDPTLVGTSTATSPTKYTIQRKSFAYGDRFWTFWDDGSQIVYASSRDGKAWSSKATIVTGAPAAGFDVDQRDGTVLVAYVRSTDTKRIDACKGEIDGSIIQWSCLAVYDGWAQSGVGPPTVAIGTDGALWVAVTHEYPAGINHLYVFRASVACPPYDFCLDYDRGFGGSAGSSVARLLAMPNGALAVLTAWQGLAGEVRVFQYGPSGWPPPSDPIPWESCVMSWDSNLLPQDVISGVPTGDGHARIVYRAATTGELQAVRYEPEYSWICSAPVTLDTRPVDAPTITIDRSGDAHAFYLYRETVPPSSNLYHIFYRRTLPLTDQWSSQVEEPIPASLNVVRNSLSAAPIAPSYASVVWSETGKTWFSAVPTPLDLGSQMGAPWNRPGISPYQTYFQQLGEYVSPGSGSLIVKQTDFVLPGRKLDLEFSRVFVTPRAFISGSAPSPYLYEQYPYANLGKGWRLNFPWISSQYVHLPDGQMYVLDWDGNDFENHAGEHFLLRRSSCGSGCYTYVLYSKTGIRYAFDSQGALTSIADPDGNTISLSYSTGRISSISDTAGRTISLAYNPDGTLSSVSTGPLVATYGYQTVAGQTMLRSVADGIGRQTLFDHADWRSAYLISSITYPTGAKTVFTWSDPVTLSSDLQAYFVIDQNTLNSQSGSIRSNAYDYTAVNGKVSYAKTTTYGAGVKKGSTILHIDPYSSRMVTTVRDSSDTPLSKTVTWFGTRGEPEQIDVYPDSSPTPSQSTRIAYDDWGNVIYTRDGMGHERFASYVNTRFQGGFFAPGRLDRTATGLIFYDDFQDRDLGDWTKSGNVGLDESKFETLPPSMNLASSGSVAEHAFSAQSGAFFAEVVVNPGSLDGDDYVRLQSGATTLVELRFAANGEIQRKTGTGSWDLVDWFTAGQWYRVTVEPSLGSGIYLLFLNGDLKDIDCLVGGGSLPYCTTNRPALDRVSFTSSPTFNIDAVKVWKTMSIGLSGLRPGQIAIYTDAWGRTLASSRVPAGASAVTFAFSDGAPAFPYGTVWLLDEFGELEFTSPRYEFWGGDTWTYTRPWKAFPVRERMGFLRATTQGVYLNDSANKPTATYVNDEDGWNWKTDGYPVAGTESHWSAYGPGIHQHHFEDATTTLTMSSGQFHIQYVYIPSGLSPSEIMLQFRDTGNSWEHRAYWGADLIPWGNAASNPDSRRYIGSLPSQSGRWLMLVVQTDDVGSGTWNVEGLSYALYGGMAMWDFSARGDPETGQIRISGLQRDWKAELYDTKGILVQSATAPTSGIAAIDVYSALPKVSAFPFNGHFLIRDQNSAALYRSPVMVFWGGDQYSYATTDFYPNAQVDSTIHDRQACTLENQTGGASPSGPIKACFRYDTRGRMDLSKVWDGSGWRETVYTYNANGLPISIRDPKQNTVSLAYSPTYGGSRLTKVSDGIGTLTRATYDQRTGWPLAESDGLGNLGRRASDSVGRITMESNFDRSATQVLYIDMEWTTEDPTPKLEDLSGQGNHGTITGPTPVPGKAGFARDFSGSSQYVRVTRNSVLEPSRLTVSAWIYPHTTQSTMDVIDKSYPDATGSGYVLVTNADGSIQFSVYDGDTTPPSAISPAGILRANAWQHVIGVYDGAYMRVFLDGVEKAATAFSGSISYNDANRDMWIGSKYNGDGRFFDGVIDEVRVFSVALPPADIGALVANTYRSLSSTMIAYDDVGNVMTSYDPTIKPRTLQLDMETILNGKLEDLAGQGRHATMTGTGAATGRIGGARDFDGIDDSVSVPAAPSLNTAAFTAALWLRRDATTAFILAPNANGGTVQWSRAGCSSNFDCVDESPSDGNSTYVYSSTLGQVDLYELANLPGGTGPILSVTITALVRVPPHLVCRQEYGEPCWADLRLRVNGYEGTVQPLSESMSYRTISQTWTTNPATGQAWTETEVNGLQAGFKLEGTNWVARVTQLYVSVSVQGGNFLTNQGLIGKPSFPDSWRIWARTDGQIEADAKNDAVGNLVSQTAAVAGMWYHVALTFDGTTARLYVNGTQEASAATADWGGAYNSALWIGDTDSTSPFDGIIDEVHLFDWSLSAPEVASLYQGTESGFYQKAYFDVLGRTTRVVRRDLFQTSVSWQTFSYDFRDQTVSTTIARSSGSSFTTTQTYDFLGRPIATTYPEFPNDPVTLSYDNVNRIRTVVAENDRKTQYLYDLGGRTTAVREYYDSTNFYTTSYAYDDVGNLLSVRNALNQVTRHEYDSLNRLTKTIYPDTSKYEQYTYDAAGNLATRRDRAGLVTVYVYDARDELSSAGDNRGVQVRRLESGPVGKHNRRRHPVRRQLLVRSIGPCVAAHVPEQCRQ